MGERNNRLLGRQLWRVPLSDGPLPPSHSPPAAAKICLGAVGGHRGLQQSLGAGLYLHHQQGWPSCFRTRIPDISRRAQRSVLATLGFSKAVFVLPETGWCGIVQPSATVSY